MAEDNFLNLGLHILWVKWVKSEQVCAYLPFNGDFEKCGNCSYSVTKC